MSLQVSDLNLTADRLAQFATALADASGTNAVLQTYCNGAAADVARLTAGYLLDNDSITNFARPIALFRAYGDVGQVPPDVETSYKAAWSELQSISRGERPTLPKQANPALQSRAGVSGSNRRIHGRMGCGGPVGGSW